MSDVGKAERQPWADLAKAICIILVVLFHASDDQYQLVAWDTPLPIAGWWESFNFALRLLRMPMFFLVSGIFFASSLDRKWESGPRTRVRRLYYLYFVWSSFYAVFYFKDDVPAELAGIALGLNWAWYLGALPTFFILARLTRFLPAWLPLFVSFAVAIVLDRGLVELHWASRNAVQSLPFFLVGARFPFLLARIAESASLRTLPMAAALLIAAFWLGFMNLGGTGPLLSVAALLAGIVAAAMAVQTTLGKEVANRFGKVTLPIYVLHFPVLTILGSLIRSVLPDAATTSSVMAATFPLVLTAVGICACLAVYRMALALGATWLFDLPAFSQRRSRMAQAAG